ncbi:MAG: GNAT family N-acetyltransferase [Pseudomonadota bacterium]
MISPNPTQLRPDISVDHITRLSDDDLDALVQATEATIEDGSNSSWRGSPSHDKLRAFWSGVALSPTRHLIVARLGGSIVGAVQIVQAGPLSEIGPEVAELDNFFLSPDARGHGLAGRIVRYAEEVARSLGIISLDFTVRDDRSDAVQIFEAMGYTRWAKKRTFRFSGGQFQAGLYYTKIIDESAAEALRKDDDNRADVA